MFDLSKFSLRLNNVTGWMRWLGLIVVTWSALLAGSLAWDMRQLKQDTFNAATVAARANINKDIGFRNWAASHGGVYVPPTEHTPPNPYLKVPDRDVVTTTGKKLTLMNPAYILREMQSDFPGEYGTRSHITSLKPINPNNAPDDWEAKALHAFEQGSKEQLEAQQIDGQPYLRMMLPLIVEQGCLKCHEQQGYKLGDIRGGISSAVPLAPFLARERESNAGMMLNHGAIWLLGLASLAWLGASYRRIQRLEILARTAAAVEKSERRFSAIAQSANDAIISADSVGKVVGWNPGAERLFGYTEAEIIGRPLTVLMPERFRNLHREGLARVVAGGAPHVIGKTVEITGLRKDGNEFPLEISLAQWQAADGQFFTAIIRDITERKRAEESLRKLSQAVEQSPSAIVITDLDANIEYVNEGFVKVTGYSRAELIGQNPRLLHSGKTPVETYIEMWACLKRGEIWKGEFINRRKDGSEYTESALMSPVSQADGRVTHYLAIKEDITEFKQALKALRVSREDLHRLLNSIAEGAYGVDTKGNCTFVNLAFLQMLGYQNDSEVLGKHTHELMHHSHADGSTYPADECRAYRAYRTNQSSNVSDEVFWRKDGVAIPVEYWSHPIETDGAVTGAIVTFVDITERKRTEESLKNLAAKYHTMFELSTDAIMLMDEKCFFDCNPATLRIFGCTTRDDFINKHPAELSPPTQPGGEDSMSLANQRIATAIKNGSNHFEWMHRRSDGTEFPAEVLLTAMELDGKPVLQATVRDITARKQAESQLTEQLDELRRWYKATSGREGRILDLKHEVNELLVQTGKHPRYPSAESQNKTET